MSQSMTKLSGAPMLCVALVLALLQVALLIGTEPVLASGNCGAARLAEVDNNAAKMGFLGDHTFRVPQTLPAMDKYCGQLNTSLAAIQTFSRECLQGLTKQVINGVLKRGRQQNNAICQTQAARQEFINKLACFYDDKIMNFHPIMDSSTARVEYIHQSVRADQSLPALCCSYQLFYADAHDVVGRSCGANTEYVENLIVGTVSDFLQLVCDGHSSLEQCRTSNKSKETLKKLEHVAKMSKTGKIKNKNKSLVPSLIEILNNASPN